VELAFRLLDELRNEVHNSVVNPPEGKQTEFHFGRISGGLFYLSILEERLKNALEEQSSQQQQREREFQ